MERERSQSKQGQAWRSDEVLRLLLDKGRPFGSTFIYSYHERSELYLSIQHDRVVVKLATTLPNGIKKSHVFRTIGS